MGFQYDPFVAGRLLTIIGGSWYDNNSFEGSIYEKDYICIFFRK